MPEAVPGPVLRHALARPFIPPTPRRAVESYWRAHPLRADRLARGLAALSGTPDGWTWRLDGAAGTARSLSFRTPPAPFREARFSRGPGHCCICGQPVFRLGWHVDLWREGRTNHNAGWHAACVAAWRFWCEPSDHVQVLKRVQHRRCAVSGGRLLRTAEVDHRVPLFSVWRERRHEPWPALLAFWGAPNLQVVNRTAHVVKCALEAGARAGGRSGAYSAPP
ncbi:hypothetical protein [Enterovirga aerilata]|nr:hypothetical protein [Enterovirga sp. DB1703]